MANLRNYKAGVVTGMIAVSQSRCYYPGCPEWLVRQVVDSRDGRTILVNNFETAHIRALNSGGPRYDESMSREQANEIDNLVLLCLVHHKLVDKLRPADYPVEILQEWKRNTETAGYAALRGLHDLTEERLQDLITEAFQLFQAQCDDALTQLQAIDLEAAKLLRPLIDELAAARFQPWFPDVDTAVMLERASEQLAHSQDTVPVLRDTAEELANLGDRAEMLHVVAQELREAQPPM